MVYFYHEPGYKEELLWSKKNKVCIISIIFFHNLKIKCVLIIKKCKIKCTNIFQKKLFILPNIANKANMAHIKKNHTIYINIK